MSELDEPYRGVLQGLPGVLTFQVLALPRGHEGSFDATVKLRTQSGSHKFFVRQCRSHLSRDTVFHVVSNAKGAELPVLVLAPHVGSGLSKELIAGGVNYLDAAGNCHLQVPSFLVHVEGKAAQKIPVSSAGIRSPGYQVLFAYLARPQLLNATVRMVAEFAGVSRQPVSAMKQRLLEEEYIFKSKGGAVRWYPRRREDALGLWLHGYATTVRGSMVLGRYRTRDKTPKELEGRLRNLSRRTTFPNFRWGGTAAGFLLTENYRGECTVLHVEGEPEPFVKGLKAMPVRDGNLVVMSSFGNINWEADLKTVHPLLVYSEMLREGNERSREAAQAVHEQCLLPLWEFAEEDKA